MSEPRKAPTCSHCLEEGHTKSSPACPLKGQEPAPRPEKKESMTRPWTPDQEAALVERVNTEPLEVDWIAIGTAVNRAPNAVMNRYNEIVPLEKQLQRNVACLSEDVVRVAMAERRWTCAGCHDTFYHAAKEWRGTTECDACYKAHEAEIAALWARINAAFAEKVRCLFCERDKSVLPFHFDHINMFDKSDSICAMVWRGDDYEAIAAEIVKCQLICCSCHAIVTRVENLVGFTRVKAATTRALNSGDQVMSKEQVEEIRQTAFALYKASIEPLYPLIMKIVNKHGL